MDITKLTNELVARLVEVEPTVDATVCGKHMGALAKAVIEHIIDNMEIEFSLVVDHSSSQNTTETATIKNGLPGMAIK